MSDHDPSEPVYHRTRAGLLAARAGDLAFLAVPAAKGGLRLASADGLTSDPAGWTPQEFWTVHRRVDDEDAFCAHVAELAQHRREIACLDRRETPSGTPTPWGAAQASRIYADGVIWHSTAEHGGFWLDPTRNALVHPLYRNPEGWYEEDGEWAKVAVTFPGLFTAYERTCADRTLRDAEPDAYEAVNGVVLQPGASRTKDAQRFARAHAGDLVVISAITSREQPGFVECVATLGGDRRESTRERRFLVRAELYGAGPFGFVIDEMRDEAWNGPTSFLGTRIRSRSWSDSDQGRRSNGTGAFLVLKRQLLLPSDCHGGTSGAASSPGLRWRQCSRETDRGSRTSQRRGPRALVPTKALRTGPPRSAAPKAAPSSVRVRCVRPREAGRARTGWRPACAIMMPVRPAVQF